MENRMNLSLSYLSPNSSIDSFLKFLEQLLDNLKKSENNLSENIKYCQKLRSDRKKFCIELVQLNKDFSLLSERDQREIELHLYNAIKEIENLFPSVRQDLKEDVAFLYRVFLIREINKTLKMFKKHQNVMAIRLYPDKKKEIISNPELYQKLVDTWGDLANED